LGDIAARIVTVAQRPDHRRDGRSALSERANIEG
jgi:hypothetical protein